METIVLIALIFILLAMGVNIGVSLALPMLISILIEPSLSAGYIVSTLYTQTANFTMIAMPFFIVAGSVMEAGGLSKRLVAVANSLVGRVTGSLGLVTILACFFFGAVSGSSTATVAAIGSIMLPEMVKAGYNKYYSIALVAAAGGLGIIVPPSFPMVVYGSVMNASIGTLFIGGIGPAIVIAAILIVANYIYCKKNKIRGTESFSWKKVWVAFKDGWPALLMPVIILGGIYGGIFTATEAAVVSVVYGVLIGAFYYRELKFKPMYGMFRSNSIFIAAAMLTMAPAGALGRMFSVLGVTKAINAFFLGVTSNPYIAMTLIFGILFIAGMFVQTTPMIVIFGPILFAVASQYGIDVFHFGLVMIIALAIAFVTPPVASNLFVVSSMTGVPVNKYMKQLIPFVLLLILGLFVVGFTPEITHLFINLFG